MFAKKNKKSPEELKRESDERIASTAKSLRAQILSMDAQKDALLGKVLEARKLGLKPQEEQARALMRRCLAVSKQAQGMLMTLELAVQSRDIAAISRQFMDCIGALSEDISRDNEKTNVKKTKEKYMRALYASQKQSEKVDEMLSIGDYASAVSITGDQAGQFDSEIDALVNLAEGTGGARTGTKLKN